MLVLSIDALVSQHLAGLDMSEAIFWLPSISETDKDFALFEKYVADILRTFSKNPEIDAKDITDTIRNAAQNGRLIWRLYAHTFTFRGGFEQMMSGLGYTIIGDFVTSYEKATDRIKSTNPALEIYY